MNIKARLSFYEGLKSLMKDHGVTSIFIGDGCFEVYEGALSNTTIYDEDIDIDVINKEINELEEKVNSIKNERP